MANLHPALVKLKALIDVDAAHADAHKEVMAAFQLLPAELRASLADDDAPAAADLSTAQLIANASDFPDIELDPGNHKFETFADAASWAANCGAAKRDEIAEKLLHIPDPNTTSARKLFLDRTNGDLAHDFQYLLDGSGTPRGSAGPLEIALFADFGTGLPHSQHIARQIIKRMPHYAFHLGDVYYAGTQAEYERYFMAPLDGLYRTSRFFNLAGNHDRYRGNRTYYAEIDRGHQQSVFQQQEGSYFRLVGDRYQVIGIDTNTFEPARFRQQKWLANALEVSRRDRLTTIVLSSEHPYDYVDPLIPDTGATELYKDVAQVQVDGRAVFDLDPFAMPSGDFGAINLWFWGNVHYAALFDHFERKHRFPFVGSCVGHGGYPYYRMTDKHKPDFVKWVETAARYPRIAGRPPLRPAMGNNGFCMMRLFDDHVDLEYVDWLGKTRCTVRLDRLDSGALTIAGVQRAPDR